MDRGRAPNGIGHLIILLSNLGHFNLGHVGCPKSLVKHSPSQWLPELYQSVWTKQ